MLFHVVPKPARCRLLGTCSGLGRPARRWLPSTRAAPRGPSGRRGPSSYPGESPTDVAAASSVPPIATCVRPCSSYQSSRGIRSAVNVPKVYTTLAGLRALPGVSRPAPATDFLYMSMPHHRSHNASITRSFLAGWSMSVLERRFSGCALQQQAVVPGDTPGQSAQRALCTREIPPYKDQPGRHTARRSNPVFIRGGGLRPCSST